MAYGAVDTPQKQTIPPRIMTADIAASKSEFRIKSARLGEVFPPMRRLLHKANSGDAGSTRAEAVCSIFGGHSPECEHRHRRRARHACSSNNNPAPGSFIVASRLGIPSEAMPFSRIIFSNTGANKMQSGACRCAASTSSTVWQETLMTGGRECPAVRRCCGLPPASVHRSEEDARHPRRCERYIRTAIHQNACALVSLPTDCTARMTARVHSTCSRAERSFSRT